MKELFVGSLEMGRWVSHEQRRLVSQEEDCVWEAGTLNM